ncbi:hypothetical protein CsSME_00048304 [Camellia sinensis var. sinensis]
MHVSTSITMDNPDQRRGGRRWDSRVFDVVYDVVDGVLIIVLEAYSAKEVWIFFVHCTMDEGEGFHLRGTPLRQLCSMADMLVGEGIGRVPRVVLLDKGIVDGTLERKPMFSSSETVRSMADMLVGEGIRGVPRVFLPDKGIVGRGGDGARDVDPGMSISEVGVGKEEVDWRGSIVMDLVEFSDVLRNVIISVKNSDMTQDVIIDDKENVSSFLFFEGLFPFNENSTHSAKSPPFLYILLTYYWRMEFFYIWMIDPPIGSSEIEKSLVGGLNLLRALNHGMKVRVSIFVELPCDKDCKGSDVVYDVVDGVLIVVLEAYSAGELFFWTMTLWVEDYSENYGQFTQICVDHFSLWPIGLWEESRPSAPTMFVQVYEEQRNKTSKLRCLLYAEVLMELVMLILVRRFQRAPLRQVCHMADMLIGEGIREVSKVVLLDKGVVGRRVSRELRVVHSNVCRSFFDVANRTLERVPTFSSDEVCSGVREAEGKNIKAKVSNVPRGGNGASDVDPGTSISEVGVGKEEVDQRGSVVIESAEFSDVLRNGFHLHGAPLSKVCSMADMLVGEGIGGVPRVVLLDKGIVGRTLGREPTFYSGKVCSDVRGVKGKNIEAKVSDVRIGSDGASDVDLGPTILEWDISLCKVQRIVPPFLVLQVFLARVYPPVGSSEIYKFRVGGLDLLHALNHGIKVRVSIFVELPCDKGADGASNVDPGFQRAPLRQVCSMADMLVGEGIRGVSGVVLLEKGIAGRGGDGASDVDPGPSISEVGVIKKEVDRRGSVVMDPAEFSDVLQNVIINVKNSDVTQNVIVDDKGNVSAKNCSSVSVSASIPCQGSSLFFEGFFPFDENYSHSTKSPFSVCEGFHLHGAPLRQVFNMADMLVGEGIGGVPRVILLDEGIMGRTLGREPTFRSGKVCSGVRGAKGKNIKVKVSDVCRGGDGASDVDPGPSISEVGVRKKEVDRRRSVVMDPVEFSDVLRNSAKNCSSISASTNPPVGSCEIEKSRVGGLDLLHALNHSMKVRVSIFMELPRDKTLGREPTFSSGEVCSNVRGAEGKNIKAKVSDVRRGGDGASDVDPSLSISEVCVRKEEVDRRGLVVMDPVEFSDVLRNVIISVKNYDVTQDVIVDDKAMYTRIVRKYKQRLLTNSNSNPRGKPNCKNGAVGLIVREYDPQSWKDISTVENPLQQLPLKSINSRECPIFKDPDSDPETTFASIHSYDTDQFREVGNAYLLSGGSEDIVASCTTIPLSNNQIHFSIHDSRSYIRFENITFWSKAAADEHSKMEHCTGLIQFIIFEATDCDNIGGSAYGGQRSFCCTPDLAKLEGCKQGEVIKLPSATNINWPIVLNIQFNGNYLSTQMDDTVVYITKTGMYDLFFISCDPKLKGLTMNGKTLWKNPDGYLPGRMAPLMKFYVIMSVAYALLSLIWFSQYMRFWKDTLQLQHCITVVIALGLFEMTLWNHKENSFTSSYTVCFNGLWCGASYSWWSYCEGAASWNNLFLCHDPKPPLVKMGVDQRGSKIVLSDKGFKGVRLKTTSATHQARTRVVTFLASELLNITEYVGTINDVARRAKVFLVLPDALLDAFLILWIFTSLSRTLEQLQAKRSSVKLDIYRKFSDALEKTVIISVAWIGYEVGPLPSYYLELLLGFSFEAKAVWDTMIEGSETSYTYSDVMEEQLDDDEAQSLCGGTPKGDLSLVKQERKEKDVDSTDVSNLEDGPEEDKRE